MPTLLELQTSLLAVQVAKQKLVTGGITEEFESINGSRVRFAVPKMEDLMREEASLTLQIAGIQGLQTARRPIFIVPVFD